jgi:hypothetical protein
MSAEVNVAARKQELIVTKGDLELAWAQLRVAIGEAYSTTSSFAQRSNSQMILSMRCSV